MPLKAHNYQHSLEYSSLTVPVTSPPDYEVPHPNLNWIGQPRRNCRKDVASKSSNPCNLVMSEVKILKCKENISNAMRGEYEIPYPNRNWINQCRRNCRTKAVASKSLDPRNLVTVELEILKRNEELSNAMRDLLFAENQEDADSDDSKEDPLRSSETELSHSKVIKLSSKAGTSFISSPPPSALPIPTFLKTSDLN